MATEAGRDIAAAGRVQQTDGDVAERRQNLRGRSLSHAAGVFSERHVANPMKAILNAPMISRQSQQRLGVRLMTGQRGDAVGRLGGRLACDRSLTFQEERLFQARPIAVALQYGRGMNRSPFEAPVAFVHGPGVLALQIGQATITRGKTPRR